MSGTSTAPTTLPWPPDGNADAAATMQMLGAMLQAELRRPQPGVPALPEDAMHAPTLMAAIGAIAGYAAQCAAAETLLGKGHKRTTNDLIRVGCDDGSVLYYGDAINRYLIAQPGSTHPLSGFLGGAVISTGHTAADLPDIGEMLRHISEVACTPAYDTLRAPDAHAPLWTVSNILRAIWPKACAILANKLTPPTTPRALSTQHWPVAAAIVAQQYIVMGKDLLPPPLAMAIVMEAALKASKRRLVGLAASPLAVQEDRFFARAAS